MDADTSKALAAFGFLTVLESPEHGLFGGYLVLSPQGRPLEFRCSTPVAPTRAQEILYGATLRPYLFAEVIGQSLLSGSELPVRLVLTDQLDMLPLALQRAGEVLFVEAVPSAERQNESGFSVALPPAHPAPHPSRGLRFEMNECRVTADSTSVRGELQLREMLEPLAAHVFLLEPFDRIRMALTEAQFASQEAAESQHDRNAA